MTQANFLEQINIHPWSYNSLGSKLMAGGNDSISDATSTVYPEANLAIYVPFWLPAPFIVRRVFWANGLVVAGNVEVGVYDAGRRLIVSGSALMTNDAHSQSADVTDTVLGPGLFFMAFASDDATAAFRVGAMGSLALFKTLGVYMQSTAFSLPSTATFAAPSYDYLPVFGITGRSVDIS